MNKNYSWLLVTGACLGVACSAEPTESTVMDAGADSGNGCPVTYVAPLDGGVTAFHYYGGGNACDITCGAGGKYHYGTTGPDSPPGLSGCTQELSSDGRRMPLFCCDTLMCTRYVPQDDLCATNNPGYSYGYVCEGPDGEPRPTLSGCVAYAGEYNPNNTYVCCPN